MVEGLPLVTTPDLRCGPLSPTAVVAHNADFEGQWYTEEVLGGIPLTCTFKASLRVWPDAPSHSNSALRYWRGLLDLPDDRAMPPHRAGPDAFVTAHLLIELLAAGMTLDHLLAWSRAPKCYPKVNFGKHRGAKWADVPADYLEWMGRQADMEADAKWCAARELKRRREAVPA
jgi:exodeoxyribonuclease X